MRPNIKSIAYTSDAALRQTLQKGFLQFPQPTPTHLPQAVAFLICSCVEPQPFPGTDGFAMPPFGGVVMAIIADAAARPALAPSTHSSEGRRVTTVLVMLIGISKC